MTLSSHHLAAVLDAPADWPPADYHALLRWVRQAVQAAGLTPMGETGANFSPLGASAVVLLAESHVAVHHWPERGKLTVDIHVCDYSGDNLAAARRLAEYLTLDAPQNQPRWHYWQVTG